MRCVAYCRVSTDDKEQLTSFKNQREYYLKLFSEDNEYEPVKCGMLYRKGQDPEHNEDGIFADEGISGTKLKNREAFNRMLELARQHMFDLILVKDITRYSRSIVDGIGTLKTLKGYGVDVLFQENGLYFSKNEDIISILMSIGQSESALKSKAIEFGQRRLREKGGWCSSDVFGYDRKGGYLHVNEQEAETVRRIFDMYLNARMGTSKIAKRLNMEGISTKRNSKWRDTTITRMLKNTTYIGKLVTNQRTNTDINMCSNKALGTNFIKPVDENEWIISECPHLQIVDTALFEAVQAEIARRKEAYTFTENTGSIKCTKHNMTDKLLSGLFVCGHCGSTYVRKQRGRGEALERLGYYWTCRNRDKGGMCEHRYMFLESDLIELLRRKIEEMKRTDFSSEFEAYLSLYHNYSPERLSEIEQERELMKRRIDKNFELYSDDSISKEDFQRRDREYKNRERELTQEYDAIINHRAIRKMKEAEYQEYLQCIRDIDLNLLTNKALKTIFRRIVIKSYGRSASAASDTTLIAAEFDFNFMGKSINSLLDDIDNSMCENTEKQELFQKIRYCNFTCIPFKRRGKKFVPDFSSM